MATHITDRKVLKEESRQQLRELSLLACCSGQGFEASKGYALYAVEQRLQKGASELPNPAIAPKSKYALPKEFDRLMGETLNPFPPGFPDDGLKGEGRLIAADYWEDHYQAELGAELRSKELGKLLERFATADEDKQTNRKLGARRAAVTRAEARGNYRPLILAFAADIEAYGWGKDGSHFDWRLAGFIDDLARVIANREGASDYQQSLASAGNFLARAARGKGKCEECGRVLPLPGVSAYHTMECSLHPNNW